MLELHSLPASLQRLHRHTFPGKRRRPRALRPTLSRESSYPGTVGMWLGSFLPQVLREPASALWREASGTRRPLCLAR